MTVPIKNEGSEFVIPRAFVAVVSERFAAISPITFWQNDSVCARSVDKVVSVVFSLSSSLLKSIGHVAGDGKSLPQKVMPLDTASKRSYLAGVFVAGFGTALVAGKPAGLIAFFCCCSRAAFIPFAMFARPVRIAGVSSSRRHSSSIFFA